MSQINGKENKSDEVSIRKECSSRWKGNSEAIENEAIASERFEFLTFLEKKNFGLRRGELFHICSLFGMTPEERFSKYTCFHILSLSESKACNAIFAFLAFQTAAKFGRSIPPSLSGWKSKLLGRRVDLATFGWLICVPKTIFLISLSIQPAVFGSNEMEER